jgi:F-type H+-transporting ATPase subunit delta
MRISRQAQREAKRLFRSCLVDEVLEAGRVRTAVQQMVEKKPRHYLPILTHFERLVRLELKRRQATVQSALPLPGEVQASVQQNLTRLYGAGLNFVFAQEAGLIGGLRVQVGSDVYEGSIRARLDALEASF